MVGLWLLWSIIWVRLFTIVYRNYMINGWSTKCWWGGNDEGSTTMRGALETQRRGTPATQCTDLTDLLILSATNMALTGFTKVLNIEPFLFLWYVRYVRFAQSISLSKAEFCDSIFCEHRTRAEMEPANASPNMLPIDVPGMLARLPGQIEV